MTRYKTAVIGALAALIPTGVTVAQPVPSPVVTIASGQLQGVTDGDIQYFKGIPYAASPVGDLRWEPPQPAAAWTGMRDASKYGSDCAQLPVPFDAAPSRVSFSEDCLFVNVWRPAAGGANLPVMVWIYGGGFVNGGTSPAVYDGSHFADKGIVFVSFNYRLGRFGFFAFPALTAERPNGPQANYGYMDQIAALKWVKANIAAFGGDPDNVMIFGESAGGGSVHTLLTSPLAQGLFNKAVIESGGGRGALMGPRRLHEDLPGFPSAETVGVDFAKSVGIDGTGVEALAALRKLPTDKVVAGLNMMSMLMASGPQTYAGPAIDGQIVVESPEDAYKAGHEAKVPIMIGSNSADIALSTAQTVDDALAPFGADKDKAREAYDPDHTNDAHTIIYSVAMDKMMVEPARFTAQEFSGQGLPAYEYRFSYVAPAAAAMFAASPFAVFGMKGAQHASEIPYVFDTVAAAYGSGLTPADEATAKAMNAYWTDFAQSANPDGGDLPNWPAYTRANDTLMNFTQDGPKAMPDPWAERLDIVAAHAGDTPH